MRRRLLCGAAAVALATGGTAVPAAAAPDCRLEVGRPASEMQGEPWGQQRLGFTAVWAQTRGEGVTVAVVDSGVDTSHPQLRGKVVARDVTKSGLKDCVGHGTLAAGIIGARDMRQQGVPFVGVAPGARLLSIKMAPQATGNNPQWTANAIKQAAQLGAKVINVSSQTPDYAFLRQAVAFAQSKDALIVAAAGNIKDDRKGTETPAYPAGYPGVLSVGAANQEGKLTGFSNAKTPVSVMAPGENIVSTWPGGAYRAESGTSFAAPYAAGTAALVRAYHPKLDYKQVKHRLESTADGGTETGTGGGMINPVRAVTAIVSAETGAAGPADAARPVSINRPAPVDHFERALAFSLAGGAIALTCLVAVGGIVIPAARRRSATGRPRR